MSPLRYTLLCLAALIGCSDGGSIDTTDRDASPGCQTGNLAAGSDRIEIDFDGMGRSYEIHAPPSYDGEDPVMLVLNFHGLASTGPLHQERSKMNATADARGFIVVYPNGYQTSWNGGACCGKAADEGIDDVGFARAMIEDIGERACIDPKRIYATGMSNGGFMSHRLACEAADVIAAAAPVAGLLGLEPGECNPSRPIPLLHMHGLEDTLVPYEGVDESIETWAEKNGCTGTPSGETIGSATCETRSDCSDGASVTLCSIENHGHCWPLQETCAWGPVAPDFPGNDVMLDFFESVELP